MMSIGNHNQTTHVCVLQEGHQQQHTQRWQDDVFSGDRGHVALLHRRLARTQSVSDANTSCVHWQRKALP